MKKITILCLTVSLSGFADTCNVAPIKKGDPAPCDGFYFNKDAENEAEKDRADSDFYQKYSYQLSRKMSLEEDENTVLQKRLTLYIDESKKLEEGKAKEKTTEDLIRIGYFSLGVLVTALVARNVQR